MKNDTKKGVPTSRNMITLAAALGALFWLLESALDAWAFQKGSFIQCAVSPDPHELWLRLLVIGCLLGGGFYAQRALGQSKRREEELAAVLTFLDTIVDMSPFPMWISDEEGTVTRVNRSLCEALNLTDDQIVGTYNVLQDANLEERGVTPMVTRVFEAHEPARFDIPWKAEETGHADFKGGRDLFIDVGLFPILNAEGTLTHVVCQWADITERKRAEQRIERLNRVLRAVQNVNQIITTERDREKLLDRVCRALVETRGYVNACCAVLGPSGDVVSTAESGWGEEFAPMGDRLDRDELMPCGRRALAASNPILIEEPHAECGDCPLAADHSGLSRLLVRIECEGKIFGFLMASVPQAFAADEEELKLFGEMADDVALALHAIELEEEHVALEAQIRHQQKLESIGTLAGGVAHEINNPINGIMNCAQLIADRLDPQSPLREFAEDIGRETRRMAKVVHNLLTFARQDKQAHSPAAMADIVESAVSLIQTIICRDQITLEVDVPEGLPQIKCRSHQIQQVLMNLLTNARDALNERYPEHDPDKIVALTVRPIEKEGRPWLRVTVEDHGAGIPEEIRDRLFDPFFTTKDRATGTGLGLSISHGIVQDHRGELWFECEAGRYTRFHLDLPVDNGWHLDHECEE